MNNEIQRPSCCAECVRYFRDRDKLGCGYCDEWAGILLHDGDVCHPNIGRKRKKEGDDK